MYQGSEEQLKNYLAASKKGAAKSKKLKEERILKYNEQPKCCTECNTPIKYESRANKFCSRTCSSTYNNKRRTLSEETKEKIRMSRTKPPLVKKCKLCTDEFITKKKKQEFCSKSCANVCWQSTR